MRRILSLTVAAALLAPAASAQSVAPGGNAFHPILEALQSPERDIPEYIEQGDRGFSVRFVRAPELAEVPYAVKMEPNLVVEYYAS